MPLNCSVCMHVYAHAHMHTHTHIYVFFSHMTKPPYSQQKEITFCPMVVFSRHCRRDACLSLRAKRSHSPKCWCTTTVWQLTLQLPWQRAWAAAQALKASCIISWCVDTLAFSSIHCDSDAFSAQSPPPEDEVTTLCSAAKWTLGDFTVVKWGLVQSHYCLDTATVKFKLLRLLSFIYFIKYIKCCSQ